MKIYYSGAKTFLATQVDPLLSLGGYVSSSQIPDNFLSSLFGEANNEIIKSGKSECICIVLHNDTVNNINLSAIGIVVFRNAKFSYSLAFSSVEPNDCDEYIFPEQGNKYSLPRNLPFNKATSFFGESKINFTETFIDGQLIEIKVSGNVVAEIYYNSQFDDIVIIDELFFIDKRIENETYCLYLIQLDLNNFDTNIDVESQALIVGNTTDFSPVITTLAVSPFEASDYLAVYIKKDPTNVEKRNARKSEEARCTELFSLYKNSLEESTQEFLNFEIEYSVIP